MTGKSDAPRIAIEYDEIMVEFTALMKRHFVANAAGVGESEMLARVTESWERTFDAKEIVLLVKARIEALGRAHKCGRCLDSRVAPGWAAISEFSASLYLGSHTDFATHCICSRGSGIPLDTPTGATCDLCRGRGIIPDWIHYLFSPEPTEEDWPSDGYDPRGLDWIRAQQTIDEHDQDPSSNRGPNPGSDEFLRDLIPAWLPKACPSCAGWGVGEPSLAATSQRHQSTHSQETTASDDFTSVTWFGTRYKFSKGNQAETVRVLWAAWKAGGHGLSGESIGEKIGGGLSHKVRDTFRIRRSTEMHPAWKTMIVETGKGVYALQEPAATTPE